MKLSDEKYNAVIIGGISDFTMMLAAISCKLKDTPLILWSEGIEHDINPFGKLLDPITRIVSSYAGALIVPGTASKEFYSKFCDQKKIFLAPDSVDNDYIVKTCQEFERKNRKLKIE